MNRRLAAWLAVCASVVFACACQEGSTPTPRGEGGARPSRDEIDKICNARKLSGADQQDEATARYTMAMWLQSNVGSEQGHAFLVEFARKGNDKAARRALLQAAVARVGLTSCPLIDEWR